MSAHLSYTTNGDPPRVPIFKNLILSNGGGESEGNGQAGAKRATGAK